MATPTDWNTHYADSLLAPEVKKVRKRPNGVYNEEIHRMCMELLNPFSRSGFIEFNAIP
jgi:hypothetical protein